MNDNNHDHDHEQTGALVRLIRFLVVAIIIIALSTAGVRLIESGILHVLFPGAIATDQKPQE